MSKSWRLAFLFCKVQLERMTLVLFRSFCLNLKKMIPVLFRNFSLSLEKLRNKTKIIFLVTLSEARRRCKVCKKYTRKLFMGETPDFVLFESAGRRVSAKMACRRYQQGPWLQSEDICTCMNHTFGSDNLCWNPAKCATPTRRHDFHGPEKTSRLRRTQLDLEKTSTVFCGRNCQNSAESNYKSDKSMVTQPDTCFDSSGCFRTVCFYCCFFICC